MTAALRLAIALPRVGLHIGVGVLIISFGFPWMSHHTRHRLIRWWSHRVLAICGMRVLVIGPKDERVFDASTTDTMSPHVIADAMRPDGIGAMLVMNHISWIDIYVVHSLRAARFIAKAEIAKWPVIGYLTDRTGTIFIERGKRHAVREVNHRVAQLLRDGDLVAMCPEGTTSDGDRLLPFHANLIEPAIEARAPIVIAGIRYVDAKGHRSAAPAYVGEINLLQSIVRIVLAAPITAEVHLIAAIDGATTTRHVVSQRARVLIAEALGFDDESEEAAEGISTVIVVPDGAGAGQEPETVLDARDELL